MSATYKHSEPVWDYTPVAAATAGDVVLLGTSEDIVGVVVSDIAAGILGAVRVSGAFEFTTEDTLAQGDAAYYNETSGYITDDSTDTYAGRVVELVDSDTVRVAINFGELPLGS